MASVRSDQGDLSAAIALRDAGDKPEAAVAALEAIAGGQTDAWAAAAYELALLLHGLGRHADADRWLRQLGFAFRLADAAFSPVGPAAAAAAPASGAALGSQKKKKKGPGGSGGAGPRVHARSVPAAAPGLPLRVVDGLLDAPLLFALQAALGPCSSFWPEHGYPTPVFFSYNMAIEGEAASEQPVAASERGGGGGSGGKGGGKGKAGKREREEAAAGAAGGSAAAAAAGTEGRAPPGGALIAAVAAALLPHVRSLLQSSAGRVAEGTSAPGPPAEWRGLKGGERKRARKAAAEAEAEAAAGPGAGGVELGSVEWWAHSRRGAGAGHQLHFDLDEAALPAWRQAEEDAELSPPHPDVSVVLYLDGPAAARIGVGAPTMVTDHDVDAAGGRGATQAWLCFPQANRALLLLGGLLHGVVPAGSSPSVGWPGAGASAGRGGEGGALRTTLMLGFWRKGSRPAAGPTNAGAPMPNMRRAFSAAPASAPAAAAGSAAAVAAAAASKKKKGAASGVKTFFIPPPAAADAAAAAAAAAAPFTATAGGKKAKAGAGGGGAAAVPAWPALFSQVPSSAEVPSAAAPAAGALPEVLHVAPVWMELTPAPAGEEEENEERAHSMTFVGSYFLHEEPGALRDRLLYPAGCGGHSSDDEEGGGDQPQQGDGDGVGGLTFISMAELAKMRGE
ncbi:hypothetical protein FOA52_004885 [Chlamydomonas sp. UWO 241]|nr:hypothetical protein FOA52_004885 [Chlamydomonas sp. UWO 241]